MDGDGWFWSSGGKLWHWGPELNPALRYAGISITATSGSKLAPSTKLLQLWESLRAIKAPLGRVVATAAPREFFVGCGSRHQCQQAGFGGDALWHQGNGGPVSPELCTGRRWWRAETCPEGREDAVLGHLRCCWGGSKGCPEKTWAGKAPQLDSWSENHLGKGISTSKEVVLYPEE